MLEMFIYDQQSRRWKLKPSCDITGRFDGCTKADFIDLMERRFPVLPIEPVTDTGRYLTLVIQIQCRDTCQWLRVNELGQRSLSSNVVYTNPLMAELEGELSIATLRFCEQYYPKSDWLKRNRFSSAEHAWYFCQDSRIRCKLYPRLFWVEKLTSELPENMGQREAVEQTNKVWKNHIARLEGNDEEIPHPFPAVKRIVKNGMNLIEVIKAETHRIIATKDDYDLQDSFRQYLDAERRYWTQIDNTEELGLVLLDSAGNHTLSEKNKRTPKIESSKPKRGRGRPPKGSKS